MKRSNPWRLVAAALVTLGFTSCSDSPEAPATAPDVHLSLEVTRTLSGAPREISVAAIVWNSSADPAYTWDDCCGLRPYLEIRDPSGHVIRSNACMAMCPPSPAKLEGDPRFSALPFNGLVWAENPRGWVPGPAGEYTVVASIAFMDVLGGTLHELREERRFSWPGE